MVNYNNLSTHINKNGKILLIVDIFLIIFSVFLSLALRFDFSLPQFLQNQSSIYSISFIIISKTSIFWIFTLYKGMWRYTSVWDMINIIKANIVATSIILCFFMLTTGFSQTGRSIFFIDLLFAYTTSVISNIYVAY